MRGKDTQIVSAVGKKRLANYRRIDVIAELEGKEVPSSLIVCADCTTCSLADDERERAAEQIKRAYRSMQEWGGNSSWADKFDTFKVLRRK